MEYESLEVGTNAPVLVQEVTVLRTAMYCAVTWDFARQHYDREYAERIGFRAPVVDPQMYGAFLARMLHDWVSPDARLTKLKLQYRRPGFAGDTLKYRGRVQEKYEEGAGRYARCELAVENQKEECLVSGEAVLCFGASAAD